jgi:hypothetical protein
MIADRVNVSFMVAPAPVRHHGIRRRRSRAARLQRGRSAQRQAEAFLLVVAAPVLLVTGPIYARLWPELLDGGGQEQQATRDAA